MAKNERKTENVVREELRSLGYYNPAADLQVEEQKTNIVPLKRLLRVASKSGKGGIGSPEFIITSPSNPDFVLLIECKAHVRDHASARVDDMLTGGEVNETALEKTKRLQRFAVDGVLHYATQVSRVIGPHGRVQFDC